MMPASIFENNWSGAGVVCL